MDTQTYKKTPGRLMEGRMVESLTELSNGLVTLPPGTRFVVERKLDGLHLKSVPCERCGCVAQISHVHWSKIDFVEADDQQQEGEHGLHQPDQVPQSDER